MGIQNIVIPGAGKRPFTLIANQVIKPAVLLRRLADFGYEKVGRIVQPGEFRSLGDVIDIFPLTSKQAFRIELFGNQIETLSLLDISQDESFEQKLEERIKGSFLKTIEKGDYIVHLDHGIGRFREKRDINHEDYYVLEYAASDKLFVPTRLAKKLTPYIGFGVPKLSRLQGGNWLATKRKVSEEAQAFARELLSLYANREVSKRTPYKQDDELLKEFGKTFSYELTRDQKNAIRDIQRDLSQSSPMDRLICGDVGFGKTEVALHAAFLIINSGRQVVLLTPTTILADQHYHYIRKRFESLGIRVTLLSRASARDIDESNTVDMVVGTHKVFSRLPVLKNLSLAIIDEEQKFGVKQKERFKALRASIDVLSLTATPIPRTFQLALAGARDVSNIVTPLPGKVSVSTFTHVFDEEKITQAIRKELKRKGQIYYLVPRIKDIPRAQEFIVKAFPQLRIAVAHGRLPEQHLLNTIHAFRNKKYDLLIATTIIENGLDLEEVNTLIVQDAQRLGLAQAHQIRGRVGRRAKKAHAYFFYNPRVTTKDAKKRLRMLERFSDLGMNWEIALKDLEIRGAGNILGKEQSGNISAVGLHLYSEILKEAVNQLKVKSAK